MGKTPGTAVQCTNGFLKKNPHKPKFPWTQKHFLGSAFSSLSAAKKTGGMWKREVLRTFGCTDAMQTCWHLLSFVDLIFSDFANLEKISMSASVSVYKCSPLANVPVGKCHCQQTSPLANIPISKCPRRQTSFTTNSPFCKLQTSRRPGFFFRHFSGNLG